MDEYNDLDESTLQGDLSDLGVRRSVRSQGGRSLGGLTAEMSEVMKERLDKAGEEVRAIHAPAAGELRGPAGCGPQQRQGPARCGRKAKEAGKIVQELNGRMKTIHKHASEADNIASNNRRAN